MDPISYGVAAKQKQRIEKVIAEPDSTSGVITVPQVIATGETITVPAGRIAVLPNVQVDGTLNVEGEVFIPSGSGLSTVVQKSGDTMSGNLAITTSSTTAYIETSINAGTTNSRLVTYPQAHASRANTTWLTTQSSSPLVFGTSNVERMRIDSLGNVGIGTNYPNCTLALNGIGMTGGQIQFQKSGALQGNIYGTGSALRIENTPLTPIVFIQNTGFEYMRIDTSGNVLVTGSGGLGYGTGSGGTVTQLTSKSTAVTLNKPSGQIIMNNASLAAGAVVTFILQNSLIAVTDTLCLNQKCGNENYRVQVQDIIVGGARIQIENRNSVSQSESIVLNFTVIKGATS